MILGGYKSTFFSSCCTALCVECDNIGFKLAN